jgi:hypothetical protein
MRTVTSSESWAGAFPQASKSDTWIGATKMWSVTIIDEVEFGVSTILVALPFD